MAEKAEEAEGALVYRRSSPSLWLLPLSATLVKVRKAVIAFMIISLKLLLVKNAAGHNSILDVLSLVCVPWVLLVEFYYIMADCNFLFSISYVYLT